MIPLSHSSCRSKQLRAGSPSSPVPRRSPVIPAPYVCALSPVCQRIVSNVSPHTPVTAGVFAALRTQDLTYMDQTPACEHVREEQFFQNIENSFNIAHNSVNDLIHDKMNDVSYNKINDVRHNKVNDVTDNEVNDVIHNKINDVTHNKVNGITDNEVNDVIHNKINDVTHNKVNDVTDSDVDDITHNKINDVTHNKVNDITHTKINDVTHNRTNDVTHNNSHNRLVNDIIGSECSSVLSQSVNKNNSRNISTNTTPSLVDSGTDRDELLGARSLVDGSAASSCSPSSLHSSDRLCDVGVEEAQDGTDITHNIEWPLNGYHHHGWPLDDLSPMFLASTATGAAVLSSRADKDARFTLIPALRFKLPRKHCLTNQLRRSVVRRIRRSHPIQHMRSFVDDFELPKLVTCTAREDVGGGTVAATSRTRRTSRSRGEVTAREVRAPEVTVTGQLRKQSRRLWHSIKQRLTQPATESTAAVRLHSARSVSCDRQVSPGVQRAASVCARPIISAPIMTVKGTGQYMRCVRRQQCDSALLRQPCDSAVQVAGAAVEERGGAIVNGGRRDSQSRNGGVVKPKRPPPLPPVDHSVTTPPGFCTDTGVCGAAMVPIRTYANVAYTHSNLARGQRLLAGATQDGQAHCSSHYHPIGRKVVPPTVPARADHVLTGRQATGPASEEVRYANTFRAHPTAHSPETYRHHQQQQKESRNRNNQTTDNTHTVTRGDDRVSPYAHSSSSNQAAACSAHTPDVSLSPGQCSGTNNMVSAHTTGVRIDSAGGASTGVHLKHTSVELAAEQYTNNHIEGSTNTHIDSSTNNHVEGSTNNHIEGSTNGQLEGSTNSHIDSSTNNHIEGCTNSHIEGSTNNHIEGSTNGHIEGSTNNHIEGSTNSHIDGSDIRVQSNKKQDVVHTQPQNQATEPIIKVEKTSLPDQPESSPSRTTFPSACVLDVFPSVLSQTAQISIKSGFDFLDNW